MIQQVQCGQGQQTPSSPAAAILSTVTPRSSRLFVLEVSGNRIHSMKPVGTDRKTIVTDCRTPDGIAVDSAAGHIYWTNMGVPRLNDGSIERANLDGSDRRVVIPEGATHTPKQIHLDRDHGKLYWTDRGDPPRGNTVNRAAIDTGAAPDILFTHLMEGIGVALDVPGNRMFFTDLGGSIYCADLNGRGARTILAAQGNLTGIAYGEVSTSSGV